VIGAAIMVGRIATGEIESDHADDDHGKDPAAVALGRKGGKARADSLTAKKRSDRGFMALALGNAGGRASVRTMHSRIRSYGKTLQLFTIHPSSELFSKTTRLLLSFPYVRILHCHAPLLDSVPQVVSSALVGR
jgi:hypothetical protein